MKIMVYHDVCGRAVLVQQILETGGHCPWDGLPFEKDYTAMLAEALATAEVAGEALENALERIAGVQPALSIDRDSVLEGILGALESLNARPRGARV